MFGCKSASYLNDNGVCHLVVNCICMYKCFCLIKITKMDKHNRLLN